MEENTVVLITGGCGYIGSHVVRDLLDSGFQPVVLDDLSTGRQESLPAHVPFYQGSCGDAALLRRIYQETGFRSVLHFAASIIVPESIRDPLRYYHNNVSMTLALLRELVRLRVRTFVLSSSAAVYGDNRSGAIDENAETVPVHPYGRSKLMDEWMLRDLAATSEMDYVILRYFNVAGADPGLRTGQCSPVATHLVKIASEAAVGIRSEVIICGEDYPTPDGSCIRDYVHVSDLSSAHVKALQYLKSGGQNEILNCGYSKGYSVREVLDCVLRHAPVPFSVVSGPRRPGDVPCLVARANKISALLDWKPEHDSLDEIVRSSISWEAAMKAASGSWPVQAVPI
ncbi:MAG: UDP-glucose 4-epimerase GalE [Deltaproteobacteria bacterium]|nr:UDP-glucose 4-epimerase GalE [Deltaproteobacteria bacterium]